MRSNPRASKALIKHKVLAGETMVSIAKQHGITLKALQTANPRMKNIVVVEQFINVPSSLMRERASRAARSFAPTPNARGVIDSAAFGAMDKRGKTKSLNPVFRQRLAMLAEALAQRGMQTLITDGLRTFAEQDALFEQGRSKPGDIVTKAHGGQSNHNFGLAVDMYPVINDKVFTSVPPGASVEFRQLFHAIQDAAGEEAERLGLFWGARFSGIVDTPHIQMLAENDMSPNECLKILKASGGGSSTTVDFIQLLTPVWEVAEKRVKPLPG